MKKIFGISLLFLGLSFATSAQDKDSEVKKDVKKGTHAVKKAGKKVGNKTAEVASKGKAKTTDAVHKDKVGPNNETIYIDNHAKYYWIDKKGRRHYVHEHQLKNKEVVPQ